MPKHRQHKSHIRYSPERPPHPKDLLAALRLKIDDRNEALRLRLRDALMALEPWHKLLKN